MPSVEGVGARRAALQMLDRCCAAARRSTPRLGGRDLRRRIGRSRVAIAGETLRRMPDLDALIDSATRQRLPDDSKARMVLRLALAQKIGLGTPDHALVATALPLVDGGRGDWCMAFSARCSGAACRSSTRRACLTAVEERWRSAWGEKVGRGRATPDRQAPPARPQLRDAAEAQAYARRTRRHFARAKPVRLRKPSVAELAGLRRGATGGCRTSRRRSRRGWFPLVQRCARPVRSAGREDHAARRRRSPRYRGRRSKSRLARLRENLERTHLKAELVEADALTWEPGASSTRSCSTRPARRPAPSAAIPRSFTAPAATSRRAPKFRRGCSTARPNG